MNFSLTPIISDESEIQILKGNNLPRKIINITDIHTGRYVDGFDQTVAKQIAERVKVSVPLYRRRCRKPTDKPKKTPAQRIREYRARVKLQRLQEALENKNIQAKTDTVIDKSTQSTGTTKKLDNNLVIDDEESKKIINSLNNNDNENSKKINQIESSKSSTIINNKYPNIIEKPLLSLKSEPRSSSPSINQIEKNIVFIKCGSLLSPVKNHEAFSILPDIDVSTFKNTSINKKIKKSFINNNNETVLLSNEIETVPVAMIINNIHQIN